MPSPRLPSCVTTIAVDPLTAVSLFTARGNLGLTLSEAEPVGLELPIFAH
jgi:hypothetical protein